MNNLRTLLEWLELFQQAVEANEDGEEITAWGAGTLTDAFAVVAATLGQELQRLFLRRLLDAYVSTAQGDELERLVLDRYGITPNPGEGDEALRERVLEWLRLSGAATPAAILFYARRWFAGVESAQVIESIAEGLGRIEAVAADNVAAADVLADLLGDLKYWRPFGVPVDVTVTGGNDAP